MSTDTTVKKRARSRKVAEAEQVVVADDTPLTEALTKKTRARKAVSKPIEDPTPAEVTLEPPKIKRSREVKKKEASRTTTTSTSKRAAKTSSNELQIEDPSNNASQILKQATAFAEERREATKDTTGPPMQLDAIEQHPKRTEEAIDLMPSDTQLGSPNKANPQTPGWDASELRSTGAVSQLPTKPSSFLNSFLNDHESAPVHPPQVQQERTETLEEGRAGLKQATKHDFEDSILSPRGTVKAQPQPPSRPSSIPSAVAALMESSNAALSSARLRAFTTSSFAALKASSKSKQTTPQAMPSTTGPPVPSGATISPPKATSELRNRPSKAPSPTSAPSSTPPSKAPAPSSAPSAKPSTSGPPQTQATAPPSIRAYPPTSLPQSPPRRPAPTPRPRPTDLSYDQLQKNAQYKSLRRKWTAVMVSIPFLVYSSYELWRRWERGDFGRWKMERDRRVGIDSLERGSGGGKGIEEELKGFDRATAGGGRAVGKRAIDTERLLPAEETTGQLLDEIPGRKSDVVVEEVKGMEAVSGKQQSSGAAKDFEASREEDSVLGRLPGLEMESGATEVRDLLREGGSKRGWVQVFK